ncbi:MAG: CPBP family glutamic-type intramembrane protease [Promethearchaeota archaeon]
MIILSIPYGLIGMNFLRIGRSDITFVLLQFLITFLVLLVIPIVLMKYKWGISLKKVGTKRGNLRLGLIYLAISLIAIPIIYFGSTDEMLQQTYPLAQDWFRGFSSEPNWVFFGLYEILYGVLYYIPYEFFWRGFVQTGLINYWENANLKGAGEKDSNKGLNSVAWKSIIIVTVATTILHATKPLSEIIGAFFVGFLFGYIAKKTDSWYYVFGIHYFIGILNDVFCSLRILGLI